jgi:hypothetical protein
MLIPDEPGRAEKTEEIPERTGNLLINAESTPADRTAGDAVMVLDILLYI